MKQHLFEQRHAADWQRFDECLSALEKGKAERQACERFANDYRHLCQHLALAQNLTLAQRQAKARGQRRAFGRNGI